MQSGKKFATHIKFAIRQLLWCFAAACLFWNCSPSETHDAEPQTAFSGMSQKDGNAPNRTNHYSVEQLDNTKGLSNSSVNCIFQDSQNLLWIGTWDGLNRYDGNSFRIFRPQPNSPTSLSNQVILKIGEDSGGQIWVLTMHGINRYDKKTGNFRQFYFSRKNKPPLSESEFNMALDNSKRVFCAVKDWGIGYFDGNDFRLLQIPGLPSGTVKKLDFAKNGDMIVLFADGNCYKISISAPTQTVVTASHAKLIRTAMRTFEVSSGGEIASIATSGDVFFLDADAKQAKPSALKATSISGSTPYGFVFSGKSGYFTTDANGTFTNGQWTNYLKKQKVTALLCGSENVIWTGTDGDGVFKIYPQKKSFNLVSANRIPEFDGGIVRSFLDVGQSLWVGTKGKGLIRLPSDFHENQDKSISYQVFSEATHPIDNAVFALCKGKDDLIFIGTDGDGLTLYDLANQRLVGWREVEGSATCDYFKSVYAIYQDADGYVWLGTNGYGMVRLRIERLGERFKISGVRRYLASSGSDSLSSNIVFSIVPKSATELWVGTRLGGLNLFDTASGRFHTFKNSADDPESLSNNDVLCLVSDNAGKLWVGTSFGLNELESITPEGNARFRSFTVADGLPDNTIHGIVPHGKSNLWISTNFGLSNFVVHPKKFINYSRIDGLQNNEFADGAFYYDAQSQLVFMGGIKGFNYFVPQQITESTLVPNLFIDRISGQNQAEPYYQSLVVSPEAKAHPSIVLKHDQNFFDIQLSALTFINNDKCRYAYKLDGFDKSWNTIDNRKIISFTNVPRGNYELWMKWTNSDGVWSQPVRAIDIRVKPVLWQSNAALVTYLILAIFFILFVRSYYIKRQSLTQNILFRKKEEEIHENRLTFFTNIAHEFLTPLTLIVGPVQKLSEASNLDERNRKFVNMIQRNSSRMLFLTQQLLEFRKAEYDYLEVAVKRFDFVNLIEQIAELFDEWAFDKQIDYHIEIPQSLPGWYDKDKTEKIVFNLMSNAFKYTPVKGKIDVKVTFEDNTGKRLQIVVTNTGKGIPKEKMNSLFDRFFLSDTNQPTDNEMFRTGIGLAYIKKLVTVLRGEILVSSVPNEQTVFTILLPCDKSAFAEKEIDLESSPVLISHHLKNILEEISDKSDEALPEKISVIDRLENNRQNILIVEDEKEIHAFLYDLLSEKYNIKTAYNGAEALEAVEKGIPDLIISDVMMPVMDGVELCRRIKTDTRTCHIPFIMLTAKDSVVHRIEGLESGANSYIPKPFYPEHLLVRINKLLEEKQLILQHFTQDVSLEGDLGTAVASREKTFVRTVIALIRQHIDSENLQSSFIEKELGISASQLYRKTKELFGLTPADLIRSMRLKYAAELLRRNVLTVSEVCYKSGFNNRSYFYREFNKVYKTTPKNYQLHYKAKTTSFSKN